MGSQRWFKRYRRTHEQTHSDSRPVLERLEPRVLLSADPGGISLLPAFQSPVEGSAFFLLALATRTPASPQIVFVDPAVPDSEALVRALSLPNEFNGQVVYLDGNRNGVEQITEVLANYQDLGAIHILSHGASGSLMLGNALLDARTVQDYADQLRDWGAALTEEGDLLLYGCSVADGAAGVSFLDGLSTLIGADIAASDDPTGSTALQGDWDLEFRRGVVEAIPAFSTSRPDGYPHVLSFTVVALPDTQSYTSPQQLPGCYDQTQWIANHAASENIALVSQLGDLVKSGALYESEWVWLDGAMDILDGTSIPYSVLPGNRDFDTPDSHRTVNRFAGLDATGNVDPALADKSFGPSRYAGKSWFVGASGDAHDYAQIFTADGQEYLHIALEWLPRASAVAWAQQQIDAHPELPVILSTHTYISPVLGDHTTASGTDAYSGEQLFQALVYPNPQVFMVLSAHDTEYHQVSIDAAGFEVLEMMDDYSTYPNGGDGWMQLVEFDPDLNRIGVQTYSPTLDQYQLDANSQFSFDFDFQERFNFHQAPMASLVSPMDQGPDDLNPAYDAVTVNTAQPHFQIQLTDVNDGVDDATVISQTVALTKNGVILSESVDYSFSYDPVTDLILLTPAGGSFGNGLYEIVLNGGAAKIADPGGNAMLATTFSVRIDTSIPVPQTVTFQEGVNGYTGTLDTDVWGDLPDNQYSTSTSVRVDGVATTLPIEGLLRFETIFGGGSGQIPVGSQIASAQLELNVTDNGNALKFYRMLRNWAETETWNTLGAGIQTDDIEAVSSPDASTDYVAALGILSIDVTASLRAWVNAPATNFGWAILQGSGTNRVQFNSSEGTTPPKLIVTFTVPSGNEPPTVALANATTSLAENTSTTARLKVADIVITDDAVGVNNLSLSGVDAALFEIDGSELCLKAGTILDYETNPVLDVTVAVDDPTVGETPDSTAALAITVTDVNEPPTVTLTNTTTSLAENTSTTPHLQVADIVITDDTSGVYDLSLSGADADLFEIEGLALYLKAGTVLDYETNPVLDVTVAVDDATVGGTPDGTAALAIAVTDVNELPTVALANATTSLAQNTSTTTRLKVADIVITDDAVGVNNLSLSGADAALFEIDGSALYLKAGTVLDYETNPVLDVTVAVDDVTVGGTPDGTAALAIAVTDVNELPTVTLANTTTSLAENVSTTPRLKVADIVITDDALGVNNLSLSGTDAVLFEIDGSALYLKAGTILDYETNPVLDVTVAVDDATVGGTPDSTAALAIAVTQVNAPPTVALANTTTSLAENVSTTPRLKVADIVITDDGLGVNDLSLSGADAALFEIDGSALYLKEGTILDYETNPLLDVTVAVDDATVGGTPDGTAALAIAVTQVNAPPTVALVNTTTSLAENASTTPRLKVADIVITDDAVGVNNLSLSGADAALFEIVGSELYLKAGTVLDYESNPVLDVTVAVDDATVGGTPDGTAALAIAVTEVNELPTVTLANTTTSLAENVSTTPRLKVADIVITDDALGVNNLSLSGADAALFEIVGLELYLKAGTVLDYETNPVLDVTVAVDDATVGGTPDSTAALAIAVTVVNQNPSDIALSSVSVMENQPVGTVVGAFSTTDPDSGNTFTYSLVSGTGSTDNGAFTILGNQLQTAASFNYEVQNNYSIRVRSTDQGGLYTEKAFTIGVTDVNEAPTVALVNTTTSLAENASTTPRLKVADIVITDDALGVNNLSLSGADAALFEIVNSTLYLKAGTVLDYETNPVLDVTVAVDDATVGGTPDGTAALAISVAFVGVPEITVLGNGVSIGDGDTTPSPTDYTDFGSVVQGGTAISRTFTVRNDGTATLTLGAVTVPAGFTLTEALSGSLAAGASDTFTVRLDTATAGTKTGDVSFATNDSDENPFNFQITGTVTATVANLALGKTAVASTSYSGYPASNVTDGNAVSRWSSQFSDNEWIYVDLGSVYTINRVVLRWEVAYGRSYKLQVSSDASTWSDVYSTTTGDGGVDDITLSSPASGRYVRMLGTQRGTMYGYSLYEMEIYGGVAVNHAPVVSSFSKSGTQDIPLAFAAGDFAGAFADPDAGDRLQKVKITSLPGHGVLTLGSTPVTVNQEVPVAQIGTLTYTPNSGYTGSDSFQWNGSDGSLYAVNAAMVNLSINAVAANLALGRPAVASTSYSGYPASNVTDGNAVSRWSSQFSDNQWIYVDLGSVYTINRVVLRWEVAYGRSYKLQVSSDASTWSDVYSTTTGDGGVDDITLSSPASGRYVRMLGTQRGTIYGYSLYELEIYGRVNHAPVVSSFSKSGTQDVPLVLTAADFVGAFADPDTGDSLQKVKIASLPVHGVLTLGSTPVTVNQEVPVAQIGTLIYTAKIGYVGPDSFQWNGSDGSLYAVSAAAVNLSINAANLALGKTAVASTSYSGYPASNVTDGNALSRWSSEFLDNQWIYVDLGSVRTISRVVLRWETAYGRGYKLQVSNDASTWSDVYSTTTGDGGVDDITLSSPASGRYVRMLGVLRATQWGYSLFEFEIYA